VDVAEISLSIPAGLEGNSILRVREEGNAGRKGGSRGDLLAQVKVKNDPRFLRQGLDILSEEKVTYLDAILGTNLDAETVDGKVQVKVPAGVQPGQKLRIRGKGAVKYGAANTRGDAIVSVKVVIPTELSEEERLLIEKLAALKQSKRG
jgi:molecular chaperone DnaJ